MRAMTFGGGMLTLLLGATLAGGVTWDEKTVGRNDTLQPYEQRAYARKFDAGRRASAVVSGNIAGFLAIYVYDAHGNCVARDDAIGGGIRDDLAVEWVPAHAGTYSVELHDLGRRGNEYLIAVRQDREK